MDSAGRVSVSKPHAAPALQAVRRGLLGRCPACGQGRLFGRFLKVRGPLRCLRAGVPPPPRRRFSALHRHHPRRARGRLRHPTRPRPGSRTCRSGSTCSLAGLDARALPRAPAAGEGRRRRPAIRAGHARLRRRRGGEAAGRRARTVLSETLKRPSNSTSAPPSRASGATRACARRTPPRSSSSTARATLPKVLMGRRHPGHTFMPGKFVFPGGRIDLGDRSMPAAGALHPRVEAALAARVGRASARRGRALALAAIRETYRGDRPAARRPEQAAPGRVPDGSWTVFRDRGVTPDLGALHFVARAITPPGRPRRFEPASSPSTAPLIAGEVGGRRRAGVRTRRTRLGQPPRGAAARSAPHHPRDAGGTRPSPRERVRARVAGAVLLLPPRPLRARAVVTFALSGCRRFRPPLRPLAPVSTAKESPPSRPRSPA